MADNPQSPAWDGVYPAQEQAQDTATDSPQDRAEPVQLLQQYLTMPNVAQLGDEALKANSADDDGANGLTLAAIGSLVVSEYRYDLESRAEWEERNEQGLKLARQVKDGRSYAGEPIADVKYPTIASAAIQYASRAYPAIVKDGEVVKYKPIGADPDGAKAARGARVAQYLNWEILEDMEDWEDDMDKLLFLQPIVGVYYKKTYRDPSTGKTCTELVSPEDLVLYYRTASFDKCPRKTQVLSMTHNEYLENVRAGAFLDVELDKPDQAADGGLHTFLEQHRTLDLDGDGYEEPYIVTVDEDTEKVLRIACRFEARGVQVNGSGQISRIQSVEYFTEYPFMPSFDGGVYGMGFGILLGPLNESINTLFNQILDAGTRSNFQGGFIAKGTRILRGGESGTLQFRRGEWKYTQAPGDDLRKAIVPLVATEPSAVLFQLLGFLVTASEKLAAQSDLLAGVQDQHNVPATSTMALMEQGLKVISGIYKRVYRSLRKEFKKVHRYDALSLKDEDYLSVIDDQQGRVADFAMADHDIIPMSTAAEMTESQQYMKAQAMLALRGQGLDDMEINKYYMESIGIPNIQRFLPKQAPQPPLQFVVAMRELDIREKELGVRELEARSKDAETAAKIREMRERAIKLRADALASIAKAEGEEPGSQMEFYSRKMQQLLQDIFTWEQRDEQRQKEVEMMRAKMAQMQQAQAQAAGPPQPGPQGPPQAPGPRPAPPAQGGVA